MNRRPHDSLSSSLVLPFVLLGFLVSSLFSLVTFAVVADFEERAIRHILLVEIESYRNRRMHNPTASPPSTAVLAGYFFPVPGFPSLRAAAAGEESINRLEQGGSEFSVMLTQVGGQPYALFYDRTQVNSSLGLLALFLLAGTAGLTLLSYLVGRHLAGQVVRPIGRLLGELSRKARKPESAGASLPSFSAADYPNNEIGRLVLALDQFALRLHGFLEREKSFAADVAHELRTPVAVIRGAAEVLVDHPDLSEPVRLRLQTIHRQAIRMGQLLEAMLFLAREEDASDDPACAMADVIDDVVADCMPSLAGRPVRIEVSVLERAILPVERSLAYVVVSNLLRNACAYTREGLIELRLTNHRLEIADTGIGIPEDRFPSLFTRLDKGEGSSGYGLGLSIVARIAQRLGWRIDVESHRGAGTRISLTFPP